MGPSGPPGGDPPDTCLHCDTTTTRYVRSTVLGQVLEVWEPGTLKFTFIYAGTQRIAMLDEDDRLHFYLNDHLGSARMVIDSTGTVKDKHLYLAFGGVEGESINTNQAYRYTGKPFDDDAGFDLYYYGARYYDPDWGRFISIDPLASKYPSWSPYVYVRNNPLRRIDPDGKTDNERATPKPLKIVEGIVQKVAEFGNQIVNKVSATVSTGFGAKLDAGPIKAGLGATQSITVDPLGNVKSSEAALGGALETPAGSLKAEVAGDLVTGDVSGTAGADTPLGGLESTVSYEGSGNFTTKHSASGGPVSVSSDRTLSVGAHLGPVGLSLNYHRGAGVPAAPNAASSFKSGLAGGSVISDMYEPD